MSTRMKTKLKTSRYQIKFRQRKQDCRDIGKRAFSTKSDGSRVPFPMPLLSI